MKQVTIFLCVTKLLIEPNWYKSSHLFNYIE